MAISHRQLSQGGWHHLSLCEQLGNIGSEVSRAKIWQYRDPRLFEKAVHRALELIDLTIDDSRWRFRLKEIARARECFLDALEGGKTYGSSLDDIEQYFFVFARMARSRV